jgi:hypothetical protein
MTKNQCAAKVLQHLGAQDEIEKCDVLDEINRVTSFIKERINENPSLQTLQHQNDDYLQKELRAVNNLEIPTSVRDRLHLGSDIWREVYRTAFDLVKGNNTKKRARQERDTSSQTLFPVGAHGPFAKRPRILPHLGIQIPRDAKIFCQVGDYNNTRVGITASSLTDHIVDNDYVYTRHISMDRWIHQITSTERMQGFVPGTLHFQTRNGPRSITSEAIFHNVLEEAITDGGHYDSATNIGFLPCVDHLLFTTKTQHLPDPPKSDHRQTDQDVTSKTAPDGNKPPQQTDQDVTSNAAPGSNKPPQQTGQATTITQTPSHTNARTSKIDSGVRAVINPTLEGEPTNKEPSNTNREDGKNNESHNRKSRDAEDATDEDPENKDSDHESCDEDDLDGDLELQATRE